MSALDVQNEILEPMQRMFTPRRHQMGEADQQLALKEYVQTLQHFDAVDLKEAWRSVLETYTPQVWPAPAVFAAAARKARAERPAPKGARAGFEPAVPVDTRPLMWWCLRKRFWKAHWREADIPEEHRWAYDRIKAQLTSSSPKGGSPT